MAQQPPKTNFLRWTLIFLAIWFGINMLMPQKEEADVEEAPKEIEFSLTKGEYSIGEKVVLEIDNKQGQPIWYLNECPEEPFNVFYFKNGEWQEKTASYEDGCAEEKAIVIEAGTKKTIEYSYWNQDLFFDLGKYKIEGKIYLEKDAWEDEGVVEESEIIGPDTPKTLGKVREFSAEFNVKEKSWFAKITTVAFYQPIYNFLIFLVKTLPGHSLGWAIIMLTIIVRTILFVPTYKSLKAQKDMQNIQPKMQALKEKYKDDQQKLGQEMMKLYKENGVNPCGSCLPVLIQMPFLIAVFYVLRSGLDPSNSYLLYEGLQHYDLTQINPWFLSFDLTSVEQIFPQICTAFYCISGFNAKSLIMPVLVGGLQFLSVWLTKARQKKQNKTKEIAKKEDAMNQAQMASNMMMYMMPLLIAWFAFSYPAGLSLYWATTTIFSIGQQVALNKKSEKLNQKSQAKDLKK